MKKIILIAASAGIFASCKKDSGCYTCERTYYIYSGSGTFQGPTSTQFNGNSKPTDKVKMCGYKKYELDSLSASKMAYSKNRNVGDTVFTGYNCN